jgi:hypothetical protein
MSGFLSVFVAGVGDTRSHRGRTACPLQRFRDDPLPR